MNRNEMQRPIWAYLVLIGGGIFLFTSLPGILLVALVPLWKPDEFSFFSIIFLVIALAILIFTIWGIKKAYHAVKIYHQGKVGGSAIEETVVPEAQAKIPSGKQKPIWPWLAIAPGALLLIGSGPAVIMLPIFPLFLAGMSTDSPSAPTYLPFLIIVIGYGLIICYIILLIMAIKALRAK